MKRKLVISVSLVLVLALVGFIKPVQTLALDFLSIFRVNDVQTIEITITDLEEGLQTISHLKEALKGKDLAHSSLLHIVSKPEHEVIKLAEAEEFDAFRFRLPLELVSQKPEISAIDSGKMTFTLDVDACNELLKAMNSPKQLSGNLHNVEMIAVSSAAAYAKYEDLLFSATQRSYLDAPEAAKNELRDVILNLPSIPLNLRQQLAEVDIDSSDIYLPVLVGFGREVNLGGKNGYIYTLADLKALVETFPQDMAESGMVPESHKASMAEMKEKLINQYGEERFTAFQEAHQKAIAEMPDLDNASVLIWAKDGILYSLIGNKTDGELAKIARSVR